MLIIAVTIKIIILFMFVFAHLKHQRVDEDVTLHNPLTNPISIINYLLEMMMEIKTVTYPF